MELTGNSSGHVLGKKECWKGVREGDIHVCLPPGARTLRKVVNSFQILPSRGRDTTSGFLGLSLV